MVVVYDAFHSKKGYALSMRTILGQEILLNVTFSIESNIYLKITVSYETNLLKTILHKKLAQS